METSLGERDRKKKKKSRRNERKDLVIDRGGGGFIVNSKVAVRKGFCWFPINGQNRKSRSELISLCTLKIFHHNTTRVGTVQKHERNEISMLDEDQLPLPWPWPSFLSFFFVKTIIEGLAI